MRSLGCREVSPGCSTRWHHVTTITRPPMRMTWTDGSSRMGIVSCGICMLSSTHDMHYFRRPRALAVCARKQPCADCLPHEMHRTWSHLTWSSNTAQLLHKALFLWHVLTTLLQTKTWQSQSMLPGRLTNLNIVNCLLTSRHSYDLPAVMQLLAKSCYCRCCCHWTASDCLAHITAGELPTAARPLLLSKMPASTASSWRLPSSCASCMLMALQAIERTVGAVHSPCSRPGQSCCQRTAAARHPRPAYITHDPLFILDTRLKAGRSAGHWSM